MESKKILVVDDDEMISKALDEKLSDEGYEVFLAKDGEEGFRMANEKHPDLIYLDILMPKVDGREMLKNLRESDNEWSKKVPVIIFTNLEQKEMVAEFFGDGSTYDYVLKADMGIDDIVRMTKEKLSS